VEKRGALTELEAERDEEWMSLGQAEALLKEKTPKRVGMAPDLEVMVNRK
jgi:hypothetical protein